jgi:ABC-type sugar transport system ATPase subunit
MSSIEFIGVSKSYHHKPVLEDVTFTVQPETFAVVFGPPGCGKSVILRLLTGLEHPTSGKVIIRGMDAAGIPPADRNIGYVPQSFALYPHYRVYDNIAYPLKLMGSPRQEIDEVVRRAASMLRIEPLLNKTPDQLSGGEKQRVAIARGIAKRTDIYVLDDPLTGLDFKLREQLFDDMRNLQESLHATFLYTTSDPLETLMLAEQVHVVWNGRVVESGPLEEVYLHPKNRATIDLLGFPRANMIPGSLSTEAGVVRCKTALFDFALNGGTQAQVNGGSDVSVAIRPQDLQINPASGEGLITFPAQVLLREDLGGEWIVHLETANTQLLSVVRHDQAHVLSDDTVTLGVAPRSVALFSADQGQAL